jgi:hypothetical protein
MPASKSRTQRRQTQHLGATKHSPITGARESNAGDDFHIVWAARRAVQTLNPRSDLHCLVVEGVSPVDLIPLDPDSEHYLAADLTEYYGGTTLAGCEKVSIVQLKYSTRHPDRAWTAARLCEVSGGGHASVIGRLADAYADLQQSGSTREELLRKASIRLVSNQPADGDLLSALEAAQEALRTHYPQSQVSSAPLLKRLTAAQQDDIRKLQDKSRLLSREFTDFLRVLDLNGCGEESRLKQRMALLREVGRSVSHDPAAALRDLCDLIRNQAQTEARNSLGINRHDVLAALGVSHQDDLFPSPANVALPRRHIPTDDARSLAVSVIQAAGRQVLAHGNAGVGKTTTVQQMCDHLPPGSVLISYDCYGAGSYLDLHAERHSVGRALLQISNDLAVECGTPFLLPDPRRPQDLLRDFARRLEAAAKIVEQAGGLLVLAVDAADNAMVAARGEQDCFVPHLWKIAAPSNFRLLMTARSHRRVSLQPPPGVPEHELIGFGLDASASHLRSLFPSAGDQECRTFHERTSHNPRVQSYLLDAVANGDTAPAALAQVLSNASKTPDSIFEDLVQAAVEHAPLPGRAREHLATLVCLSRPIPRSIFAQTCGLTADEATNFIRALWPGVVFSDESISFRDEDFETHLRSRAADDLGATQSRLGTYFLMHSEDVTYAAQAVAEHLYQAGRLEDVIHLALEGPSLDIVSDELLRLHVRRRRIELAMYSACRLGRDTDGVRLVLLAAETARADDAVTALVRTNPELATLHGDARSVARLYSREENSPWLGSAHLRIAALYARDKTTRDYAEDHLQHAYAWFRRWQTLPKSETSGWQMSATDIARGAEAVFHLRGATAARDWLKRWRPVGAVLEATRQLTDSLTARLSPADTEKILAELRLPLRAECVLLAELWHIGHPVEQERVRRVLRQLDRWAQGGGGRRNTQYGVSGTEKWAVPLCEMGAFHEADNHQILRVLAAFGSEALQTIPSEFSGLGEFDLPLRAACLRAVLQRGRLTADDLLPERYRRQPDDKDAYRNEEERRRFSETVGKLLPIHLIRARVILTRPAVSEVSSEVQSGLQSLTRIQGQYENRYIPRQRTWSTIACNTLLLCQGDAGLIFEEIANAAEATVRGAAPNLWLDLAELIISHEAYRQYACSLAERSARYVTDRATPGRERWETLLRCAEAVAPYDSFLCKDFYQRALEAAEGIDDDSAHLLEFQAHLAHRLAPNVQGEEGHTFGRRFAVLMEAHRPYVSDPSLLPWQEALDAICRLDPAGGLALCSRWDEQNIEDISTGIVPVVQALSETAWITPQTGLSLLRLAGERLDLSSKAIPLLTRLYDSASDRPTIARMLDSVCRWSYRDTPLGRRAEAFKRVVGWADEHGMSGHQSVEQLRVAMLFTQTLYPTDAEDDHTIQFRAEYQTKAAPFLEAARHGKLEDFEAQFEALQQQVSSSDQMVSYLKALGLAVPPARRIEFLNAVVQADVRSYNAQAIVEALHGSLHQWHHIGAIRQWVPPGITELIKRRLPELLGYDDMANNFRRILSLPNMPPSRIAVVLPGVIGKLDRLGAKALYAVATVLIEGLDAEGLRQTLDWSLLRLKVQIEQDGKSLVGPGLPSPALEPAGVLAAFLWALSGHADRRVRWRALHAARGILEGPNASPGLLDELLKVSHSFGADVFVVDPNFYWMSARTSFLLLFERLADDQPQQMAPFAADIARHALDETFPHAQIRELARRAALRIVRDEPAALSAEVVDRLQRVNQPISCRWPRQSGYAFRSESLPHQPATTRRFQFDTLDTTRYWFDPLARIFGSFEQVVEDKAEHWICDRWGRTDVSWQTDPRGLNERYEWGLRSNSHGSVPPVENLRTYLEYHAMMCAAGEMVCKLPIAVEDYDDPGCPWDYWISESITAFPDCWLADVRRPTPLRPEFWGQFLPLDEWLQARPAADYDAGLGLGETGHVGEILLYGRCVYGDSGRRGGTDIVSALVSPETARSLMRAMQSTKRHNYSLPVIGWSVQSEDGIDEPAFQLLPLLRQHHIREETADHDDPLARGTGASFETFDDGVLDALKLSPDKGYRGYYSLDGTLAAKREIWSDDIHTQERISEPYSYGHRLWIRLDLLLSYLRECNLDLIVEVVLSRNSTRNYEDRGKYDIGRHAIYLLRQDGTIETVAGSRPAWEEDRPRTRLGPK